MSVGHKILKIGNLDLTANRVLYSIRSHFALTSELHNTGDALTRTTLRLHRLVGLVAFAAAVVVTGTALGQPPPPTIDFANGTPTNSLDAKGNVISGKVKVDLTWANAPLGGGNS
ncbi:MAG: hypothetical protein K2X87_14930 [Gemmataceae bacterium]|nr:hypothetical protein [Gemmataceae bacterium]